MAKKNIVILSDGTGNSAAKLFKTNVWRIGDALDLSKGDQIYIYDDGVGTERFKPLALLGGAVGLGLQRNVQQLYAFLCRNYRPGDDVYLFGFSRGAFTIRVLVGLIHGMGLVSGASDRELQRNVRLAFQQYRSHYRTNLQKFFDRLLRRSTPPSAPHPKAPPLCFVGLWDTVDAYGLPVEELKKGIYYWFKSWDLPDRKLSPIVKRACHALSLDDQRRTFHPLLWDEREESERTARHNLDPHRLTQVWFTGVHSNVGGGYPEDGLSYVTLAWMMREAQAAGLRLREQEVDDAHRYADWNADLYDSRSGLASYYRYDPRDVGKMCSDDYHGVHIARPKIHESVFRRIKDGVVPYAPTGLPAAYDVAYWSGAVAPGNEKPPGGYQPFEDRTQANKRARDQELARDTIWWRRVTYLLTVLVSLYLALFPMVHPADPQGVCTGPLCLIDPVLGAVEAFVPTWSEPWLHSFRQTIDLFVLAAVGLGLLMWWGSRQAQKIEDRQAKCWSHIATGPRVIADQGQVPNSVAYAIRNNRPIVRTYQWFARSALPFMFAMAVALAALFIVNKGAMEVLASAGGLCRPSAQPLQAVGPTAMQVGFSTNSLCGVTGLTLEKGTTYEIKIDKTSAWFDWHIPATADGISKGSDVRRLALGVPLRRKWAERWFQPIARIGSTGRDEYTLGEQPTQFVARSSGELFLYVNDAIIVVSPHAFYDNNTGTANVTVTRIKEPASVMP